MTSTRSLSTRAALAAPIVAGLIIVGCGSSDDDPDTTISGTATTVALDGAGTELQPGSNQPPDETPSISGDTGTGDTMTEGTPGPNDEGVPDAGSMVSVDD